MTKKKGQRLDIFMQSDIEKHQRKIWSNALVLI